MNTLRVTSTPLTLNPKPPVLTRVTSVPLTLVQQKSGASAIVAVGPQGPQGLPGASTQYVFDQTTPSANWVVNHMLGFHPSIQVLDNTFAVVWGVAVIHTSLNQFVVQPDVAFAGHVLYR